jgi:hypothetical protein
MHIASSNECTIAFGVAFCTAGNLVPADDCGSTPARFDGVGSLHYATVAGDAGSRIYLHPQISNSCISGDAPQACDADAHGLFAAGR